MLRGYRFSHLPPGDYYLASSAGRGRRKAIKFVQKSSSKACRPVQDTIRRWDMCYSDHFLPGVTELNRQGVFPSAGVGSFTAESILQRFELAHVLSIR